jgi:hypothetical protein
MDIHNAPFVKTIKKSNKKAANQRRKAHTMEVSKTDVSLDLAIFILGQSFVFAHPTQDKDAKLKERIYLNQRSKIALDNAEWVNGMFEQKIVYGPKELEATLLTFEDKIECSFFWESRDTTYRYSNVIGLEESTPLYFEIKKKGINYEVTYVRDPNHKEVFNLHLASPEQEIDGEDAIPYFFKHITSEKLPTTLSAKQIEHLTRAVIGYKLSKKVPNLLQLVFDIDAYYKNH